MSNQPTCIARRFALGILPTLAFVFLLSTNDAIAQPGARGGGIAPKKVNIYSEGTRMAGDLYLPADFKETDKRPAIILSHGWGGNKAGCAGNARAFAQAGFVALAFDYRSWGESDPLLIIKGDVPRPDDKGEATIKVQLIREVVDPLGQCNDIRKVFDYICGEPGIDTNRLGYWGSSYSGGHAVWVAINEPRAKAVVGQVPAADSIGLIETSWKDTDPKIVETAKQRATQRARGEINPLPFRTDKAPNLRGWAYLENVIQHNPAQEAGKVKAAMLLIDAENEELYSRHNSGELAANNAKAAGATVSYVVLPKIQHYGVYQGEPNTTASKLAVDWFNEHLKNAK